MPSRAVKRQKIESGAVFLSKHNAFADWANDERDIYINGVKPAYLKGRGMGLVTSRKVCKSDELITVRPHSMIQPDPELFESSAKISPQAKLAFTLMSMDLAEDPLYRCCSSVWPDRKDFEGSLFWYDVGEDSKNEPWWEKLPPVVKAAASRLLDDFHRDIEALRDMKTALSDSVKSATFIYYWTIANTRSFAWKPNGQKEGTMVMCPFLDYMNHCPSETGCTVKVNNSGFTLIANRDYNINEEILATYGAHSNDKLLVHYGFTVPDSSDDSISLDAIIMPHLTRSQKQDLEAVGYLGNYSLTPDTNELCFRTQVALRARCLTSNEWEFFMNSGDDIATDQDADVRRDLAVFIQQAATTRATNEKALQEVKNNLPDSADEKRACFELILQRCDQIESALTQFCGINPPLQ
ncbi:hypothetical protein B9Z65_1478 [Elsinoe australis]|uniref:Uncharacterized protein n=1 Tax=Elsinoe australis TaxID=40998 RepID=A0A2P7YG07_9PEZI|nr:hypothetical protein B9Z65_1478 [Elsinoe australis]